MQREGESARREDRVRRPRGEIEENISARNVTVENGRPSVLVQNQGPASQGASAIHDSGSPFRPANVRQHRVKMRWWVGPATKCNTLSSGSQEQAGASFD